VVICLSLALGARQAPAEIIQSQIENGILGKVTFGGPAVIPIPLANNVSGAVTVAGNSGINSYAPGAFTGPIVTLATATKPIRYSGVGVGNTSATSVAGKATSSGYIQAAADPDGKSVDLTPTTTTTTLAAGLLGALYLNAASKVGTDPFVLDPLASATPMTVEINLNPSLAEDPCSAFSFQAVSSDNTQAIATDSLSLDVTTNIPGLTNIMSMTITDSSVSGMCVSNWCSPVLAQPFAGSDFTADDNGVYTLNPSLAVFDLTFMVPAGDFATDGNGDPMGLQLNLVETAESMITAVPEPATILLVGWLGVALVAVGMRRRK